MSGRLAGVYLVCLIVILLLDVNHSFLHENLGAISRTATLRTFIVVYSLSFDKLDLMKHLPEVPLSVLCLCPSQVDPVPACPWRFRLLCGFRRRFLKHCSDSPTCKCFGLRTVAKIVLTLDIVKAFLYR